MLGEENKKVRTEHKVSTFSLPILEYTQLDPIPAILDY